jgi:hypothetical protein
MHKDEEHNQIKTEKWKGKGGDQNHLEIVQHILLHRLQDFER